MIYYKETERVAMKMTMRLSLIMLGAGILFTFPQNGRAQNIDLTPTRKAAQTTSSPVMAPKEVKVYAGQNSKYTLGKEDVIEVTVLRHPEVSGSYTLNSEGKIQFEFAGDIQLTGMSKEEAAVELAKHLEAYIMNPSVAVKITGYNSKVVYVVGEVGQAGKIYMRGDTITVRDALLAAGLPQLTASTKGATLFTPSETKVTPKRVDVYALLYKGDLKQNYTMSPGDTIYLPPTLWAKIGRIISPVTQPIQETSGAGAAVGAF